MTNEARAPRVVKNAAALIIGAELLSGKVKDENVFALSNTLRALGIEFARVVICPDDRSVIAADLRALRTQFDVVFTSGGVGPTHDDVTIDAISDALGVKAVSSPALEALLARAYGDKLTDTHLLMARVPEGAELAEGTDMRWPLIVAENVWIFPGVPELFRMKLASLREHLKGPATFFSRRVFCTLEETALKEQLDQVVAENPQVAIGSYPKWFEKRYKTELTFDALDEALVIAAEQHARRLFGATIIDLD